MQSLDIMVSAAETSGDVLGAELVSALRGELERRSEFAPRFFGAGGPRMAAAGVEILIDLPGHAITGVPSVAEYVRFRRFRDQLAGAAAARTPALVVCVDAFAFHGSLAAAIRRRERGQRGPFVDWHPRIVQYVSPQVWASRPGRARRLARDFDLLLCLLPFEKAWYAEHAPGVRAEFVGHPIVERGTIAEGGVRNVESGTRNPEPGTENSRLPRPVIVLLPGSRGGELRRHLPVMLEAAARIRSTEPVEFVGILPDERQAGLARTLAGGQDLVRFQNGGLHAALRRATLAIASTGTVTLECALAGVPTVALYKTSPLTYAVGRRIVRVKWLSMPNLLANEAVFPEFIQDAASAENLAAAALALLGDESRRRAIQEKLRQVVAALGEPGASRRAAAAIAALIPAKRPLCSADIPARGQDILVRRGRHLEPEINW